MPTMPAFYNTEKVVIQLSPNGPVDAPPTWNYAGPGYITVDPDYMRAEVVSDEAGAGVVSISAVVDVEGTEEVETISATVDIVWAHSKASDLGVSVSKVPR